MEWLKEVRSALTSPRSFHLLYSLPINVSQRCTVKIGSYCRPNKSNLQREHLGTFSGRAPWCLDYQQPSYGNEKFGKIGFEMERKRGLEMTFFNFPSLTRPLFYGKLFSSALDFSALFGLFNSFHQRKMCRSEILLELLSVCRWSVLFRILFLKWQMLLLLRSGVCSWPTFTDSPSCVVFLFCIVSVRWGDLFFIQSMAEEVERDRSDKRWESSLCLHAQLLFLFSPFISIPLVLNELGPDLFLNCDLSGWSLVRCLYPTDYIILLYHYY